MGAKEYLQGEFNLRTPSGGLNDASAKIRVFYNPEKQDENLEVTIENFTILK